MNTKEFILELLAAATIPASAVVLTWLAYIFGG